MPLYARRRSLACVIGVHLPMPSALGVFNHASGNRSRWRRSQSDPRKRTQCRVPFGREVCVWQSMAFAILWHSEFRQNMMLKDNPYIFRRTDLNIARLRFLNPNRDKKLMREIVKNMTMILSRNPLLHIEPGVSKTFISEIWTSNLSLFRPLLRKLV